MKDESKKARWATFLLESLPWLVLFLIVSSAFIFAFHVEIGPKRVPSSMELALQVKHRYVGNWKSIIGTYRLTLGYDDTVLIEAPKTEQKDAKSTGTWGVVDDHVHISYSGDAGASSLDYQIVEYDRQPMLVPYPAQSAMVKDCFVEDVPDTNDDDER